MSASTTKQVAVRGLTHRLKGNKRAKYTGGEGRSSGLVPASSARGPGEGHPNRMRDGGGDTQLTLDSLLKDVEGHEAESTFKSKKRGEGTRGKAKLQWQAKRERERRRATAASGCCATQCAETRP